jgi:pyruvate-formate lyase-activating enzyme
VIGVYPDGFPNWETAEIEKFMDSNPRLYEERKTAHLRPTLVPYYTVSDEDMERSRRLHEQWAREYGDRIRSRTRND